MPRGTSGRRAGHGPGRTAGIGDEAVAAKTGKTWPEWFGLLDAEGARAMDHKGVVRLLREEYGLGSWWQQMVAVGYEQARGKRKPHEKAEGFEVSASTTIAASTAALCRAWTDAALRRRWLPRATFTVTTARPGKALRLAWGSDGTRVVVAFNRKRAAKTQVVVQHGKLPSEAAARRMKSFWKARLGELAALRS